MTIAQKAYRAVEQIKREQAAKLTARGYRLTKVTESEYEDGVGVAPGLNAIHPDGGWDTLTGALRAEGERIDFRQMAIEAGLI